MNSIELWQRYQDWLYFHEGLGVYLDISRMPFNEDLLKQLQPKFIKAFNDMAALESGAIANPDENRMVGHYWLRNPQLAPTYLKKEIEATLLQIDDFVRRVHHGIIHPPYEAKFTDIISIGIGGSALGPQFVSDAIGPDIPALAIHFIDNTDPAGIDRILKRLKDRLKTTLVIVISKSGGTSETRNGLLEVKHAYTKLGLHFPDYAVALTMTGSKMDEQEHCDRWIAKFPMFDWVGGRTSELSPVGLLSAALIGIDIKAMLEGAMIMDEATRIPDLKNNPAALMALSWYAVGDGKGDKDMVILPYKDSLLLFSRYLQQLVMESLGKEFDLDGNTVHQGMTVYGNKGSTDQHAYVQQLREGVGNFFATFIEVLEDRTGPSIQIEPDATSGDFLFGCLQGTCEALYENHRASMTITLERVDARNIGALIALYERAVGLYATLININAYHQPGVEAGKKAATQFLALQQMIVKVLKETPQPLSLEALAERIETPDHVQTVYKIVRHMAANHRGFVLQGDLHKPAEILVSYKTDANDWAH